jgi:tRNA wybutosine-synthesizing protein 5
MWSPDEALNLYLDGDKSRVIDIDDPDVVNEFPRFGDAVRHVADLQPGDVLFIPALWYTLRP